MALKWMIRRGEKERGPLSSQQLRNLASTGKLKPTDLVRRGETGEWKEASSVSGLLSRGDAASATAMVSSVTQPSAGPPLSESLGFIRWYKTKWMAQQPVGVQVILWLFYGLLWIPAWFLFSPDGSKTQKACFGGTVIAYFVVALVGSHYQRDQVNVEVTSAHSLWDGGKQPEAIASYRRILEYDAPFLEENDRELLFERVITFDVENGNSDSAIHMLDRANSYGVTVTSESIATQTLIAKWKSQKEQENAKSTIVAGRGNKSENDSKPAGRLTLIGWFKGDELLDFLDNPTKYKDFEVTLDAKYLGEGFDAWMDDGKFTTSVTCPFVIGKTVDRNWISAELSITIPAGTKSVPIRSLENARVKFRCADGSLAYGNEAISIERP